jgi:hypothetical protein
MFRFADEEVHSNVAAEEDGDEYAYIPGEDAEDEDDDD